MSRFVSILAGRREARRYCARVDRDITFPASSEESDVEDTIVVLHETSFPSLKALSEHPEVRNALWERTGDNPYGAYIESEWAIYDMDGRESRDYMEARRCNGEPLTFGEAFRLDRLLGLHQKSYSTALDLKDKVVYERDRKRILFDRRYGASRQRWLP